MVPCSMTEWRQLQSKQRHTRYAKGKRSEGGSIEAKDEVIVYRISSEPTGKQQKYTRKFVPFEFDEITLKFDPYQLI